MRKVLFATAFILLTAIPVFAQLAGTWNGEGTGTCDFYGTLLRPWETWTGTIPATEDSFTGIWSDGLGNSGTFFNTNIEVISDDIVVIEGRWTLTIPDGLKKLGTFKITFYTHNRVCYGEWDSPFPTVPPRTIYGKVVW